jgi:hypothetical protein
MGSGIGADISTAKWLPKGHSHISMYALGISECCHYNALHQSSLTWGPNGRLSTLPRILTLSPLLSCPPPFHRPAQAISHLFSRMLSYLEANIKGWRQRAAPSNREKVHPCEMIERFHQSSLSSSAFHFNSFSDLTLSLLASTRAFRRIPSV